MATEFEDATVERLLAAIGELGAIKVMMGMTCTMEKEKIGSDEGGEVGSYVESVHRYGTMATLTNADADAMREFVAYSMAYVIEEFEKFITNGSGWVITAVEKLDLRIDRYHPGRGGSYMACPAWLVNKQCCINIKNEDDNCFRYATTASIDRPKVHPERVHYYKKLKLLKFAGIEMPAPATDTTFKRFETLNPDYALLVYRCPTNGDRDDLCVTYRSPHIKERKMIPLVMLYDAEAKDEVKSHYITVTNVDGLVRKDGNKEATCWYCMHTFAGANAKRCLEQHQQSPCDIQRVELPIKNVSDKLEFTDFEKTLNVPYAIYADFESSLVPIKEEEQQCGGSTQRLNRHVANSFAYTTVGLNGEKIEELSEFFRGPDAGRYCLLGMQRVAEKLKERMQAFRERAPLSPVEEALWEAAEICHLCGKCDMTPAKYKTGQEKPVRLKKDGTPYKVAEPKNVLFRNARCATTATLRVSIGGLPIAVAI